MPKINTRTNKKGDPLSGMTLYEQTFAFLAKKIMHMQALKEKIHLLGCICRYHECRAACLLMKARIHGQCLLQPTLYWRRYKINVPLLLSITLCQSQCTRILSHRIAR